MKTVSIAILAIGAALSVAGLIHMNSNASQLRSAFGGTDEEGITMLIIGIIAVIGGAIALSRSKSKVQ